MGTTVNFVGNFGANFTEKQSIKTANFMGISGQICSKVTNFYTDLRKIFKEKRRKFYQFCQENDKC